MHSTAPERRRRRPAGGFTLVELLVVIAIIGTLVGLLLPAVQAARESARRSACGNNLKQVALAVHNFADARGRLPCASADPAYQRMFVGKGYSNDWNWRIISWVVSVLPFLEQQNLYDEAMSKQAQGQSPGSGNSSPYNKPIVTLICGSDPVAAASRTRFPDFAATSYRCNRGDVIAGSNESVDPRGPFGVGHGWYIAQPATYKPVPAVTWSKITDGVSKTILLAESNVGDGSNLVETGISMGQPVRYDSKPSLCTAAALTTAAYSGSYTRGRRWGHAADVYTGFFTIMPPNGPVCSSHATNPEDWSLNVSATSYHPGGASVAMCDGAIRFVTSEIDTGNPDDVVATSGYSGPTRRGVWGALGSRAGGEQVSE